MTTHRAWMAAAVMAVSQSAFAGTITGTVKLSRGSDAERTVVYVENVAEGGFAASPTSTRLSQRGATFNPGVLPLIRGSHVDMSNDDWVAHNVFSKSAPKPFDLGIYAQDAKKVVTFEKPGVVEVFCSIHPRMNAVVLVLQNPFYTKPERDGRFTIQGVPGGTYQLKVYRPGAQERSVAVKVPAAGSIEVEL